MAAAAHHKSASKETQSITNAQFEIYRVGRGEYRVRFKVAAEVVFNSEGYASKRQALKAIYALKAGAGTADVIGNPKGHSQGSKLTFIDHILSGPEWPEEMYEEVNRRAKSPSRLPIDF